MNDEQAIDVGLFAKHVKRPHHAVAGAEVRRPVILGPGPVVRWPALIALMIASRFSSFIPIRRIAAAAPPVA